MFVRLPVHMYTKQACTILCRFFAVNVGEDCPVFDGLFEFCQLSGGGSVGTSVSYFKSSYFILCIHRKQAVNSPLVTVIQPVP